MLTDTALSLGPVTLFYNREPEMRMCPICRPVEREGLAGDRWGVTRIETPGLHRLSSF